MDKCNTCFFGSIKDSPIAPCKTCSGYNKYVKDSVYFWGQGSNPSAAELEEIFREDDDEPKYDTVNKPKHYMLFEEEGIEVRDVIAKLVQKMERSFKYDFSGMNISDYVQAMQYLMRFMDKNGVEDLQKAVWYLYKVIDDWEN